MDGQGVSRMPDVPETACEVLSPWAEVDSFTLRGLAPRLDTLEGRTIGLFCNNKRAAPLILESVERVLKEQFPSVRTSWFHLQEFGVSFMEPEKKKWFDDWVNSVDAVIAAVGDSGAATRCSVRDIIDIESCGKPATLFINEYFFNVARSAAALSGMPFVRVVPEMIVSEATVSEDIDKAIVLAADAMLAALVRPLSDLEKEPVIPEPESTPRLVFQGSIQGVNRFFYQRGWTDGLPIMPPTEEAVAEMLTGTDLPPGLVVARLEPRRGKATVEKIAVNAVMAGCLPTHLPVIIAGVEALVEGPAPLMAVGGTGSSAPCWLINGPVARNINARSSYGVMSPGDIANASIGRALNLIIRNLCGIRKQIEEMGVFGHPGKYSMVIAESEEFSSWTPFHVERGFKPQDSTITLGLPRSFEQVMPPGTDEESLLAAASAGIRGRPGSFYLLLNPAVVKTLAAGGWTKSRVKEYIAKHAGRETAGSIYTYVTGGFGSWMGFMHGGPPPITKKIKLPEDWDTLVRRYRNLVPHHVRY